MIKTTKKTIKISLAGNPNCGKTTLFNKLTGNNQYVGNWPGVTIEKKSGKFNFQNHSIEITDLPGIYSLAPYSQEEIITRNSIVEDQPDIIINVVDATNIERNLYLTTQLAELGKPIIIALNMIDSLEKRGDSINFDLLESKLGIPIVPISAYNETGLDKLIEKAITLSHKKVNHLKSTKIYSEDIEMILDGIEQIINTAKIHISESKRFAAIKLFEEDKLELTHFNFNEKQQKQISKLKNMINVNKNMDHAMIIADQRYKYICSVCNQTVHKSDHYISTSEKIDKLVTGRFLALPVFFFVIFLIFFITFGPIGNSFRNGMEYLIKDQLANNTATLLNNLGASDLSKGLVVNGMISGVGSVVSFLPQIMILFAFLSFLEDSGYMARAAFIMDHFLRKLGLSGKSFVPMIMGFGCTVPAILSTRTLENEKDKRLTILMTPFMSCGAKMPVYALFISIFFTNHQPLIIFSLYIFGIIIAILTGLLFKNTLLKGEPAPFLMELPPYRLPRLQNLWLHVWERLKDFLSKAGTVLLVATIIIWFLQSFNFNMNLVSDSSESILANLGKFITPIFIPCGFGTWKASVSLVTGIVAKESVVSTMAVLYGGNQQSIADQLQSIFSPLAAYSFMIFVLLYTPCIAALAAIKKEMRSLKWTFIAFIYQLSIAWLCSTLIFQLGTLVLKFF